jgi:hypothetical protein
MNTTLTIRQQYHVLRKEFKKLKYAFGYEEASRLIFKVAMEIAPDIEVAQTHLSIVCIRTRRADQFDRKGWMTI